MNEYSVYWLFVAFMTSVFVWGFFAVIAGQFVRSFLKYIPFLLVMLTLFISGYPQYLMSVVVLYVWTETLLSVFGFFPDLISVLFPAGRR